ncbi:pectin lyase fold/virulence factor [Zychaea mexicana]|uniref:pectin lyase fold/virulence factor n=1 Tax=Zychaea mexicana TaxID=64656 RepID=UPI0022FF25A6|nr:pectin lyase fold/virulence factor [Zychaea mexicana]KAI9494055.1 pectin lyase fold/virulence factor [Zychaea mexicana]
MAVVLATTALAHNDNDDHHKGHGGRRRRTCMIPHKEGDTSDAIMSTFKKCSQHSRVVFNKNFNYMVHKPMNISGLNDVHISIQGNVTFDDSDMAWWQENIFLLDFQSAGTYWVLGGDDIRVDGGGTVDGQGQVWWDAVAEDPRPVTMTFDNVNNLHVSDIWVIQSPFWHIFVRNANNAVFTNMNIWSETKSSFPVRNSDGWDLLASTGVVIKDSVIANQDDCVSFKYNTTNTLIENLDCTGSHGLSVGSLGQYARDGQIDAVTDIVVRNVTCRDCENGARIKTWAGGKGLVENITFTNMEVTNAENAIVITTHYCDGNQPEYCVGSDDASLTIRNITFDNIFGSASEHGKPIVTMNCSIDTPCTDITLTNIDIEPASNTEENVCEHVTGAEDIPYCPQYQS